MAGVRDKVKIVADSDRVLPLPFICVHLWLLFAASHSSPLASPHTKTRFESTNG